MKILNKGEIKTFSDKRKLRLFIGSGLAVQKMPKDIFQANGK